MNEETLLLNNLSIGYKTRKNTKVVVENLSARISEGKLTCLIGSNGSGKSTLLRTLAGFQPPLSGNIKIYGKDIQTYSDRDLSKLIGVVLTEKVETGNMSVRELAATGRNPYTGFWGKLSNRDEAIIEEAIERVNIRFLADRQIYTLSDGERQKAMIAKVLTQQTPIIFLDEPTAFLDFRSKIEIMQLLYDLCRKMNKTIFLSSHDLDLSLQIADILWILDKERKPVTGSPEKLINDGIIDRYFQSKGVVFDKTKKSFKIKI
ncbi:MAG: ABC transporter ATP-binding protein [Dysgonamonadaceae bacterium]|jgi:iron complex transport system ATP-binding protein|nr:ABC transporter ATP-binding protein [Dysgonamonadaceae bacterium]